MPEPLRHFATASRRLLAVGNGPSTKPSIHLKTRGTRGGRPKLAGRDRASSRQAQMPVTKGASPQKEDALLGYPEHPRTACRGGRETTGLLYPPAACTSPLLQSRR